MQNLPLSQIRVDPACFASWQRITDHSFVQLPNGEITTREGIADAQVLDDGRLRVVCVIGRPQEWWMVEHSGTETRLPSLGAFSTRTRDGDRSQVKAASVVQIAARMKRGRCR